MRPVELLPRMRGFAGYSSASRGPHLAYDRLSSLGKALIVFGLLAPLIIITGQIASWFYKGVWPTERVSLVWDAVKLSRMSAHWTGVQIILELWLALPLWLGVMCFLIIAGYLLGAVASVLRRYAPR